MVGGLVQDLSVEGGRWVVDGPVGGSVVCCRWSVGRLKTCRWVGGGLWLVFRGLVVGGLWYVVCQWSVVL